MRHDTWQNFTTGLGTQRDKTTRGHFWPDLLLQHNELLALFNGSALARKVCEKRPTEIMRKGYDITIDGMKPDDVEDLLKAGTALKVDQRFFEALVWAGVFGGGLILMGLDDGQTPDKPLDEDRIKSFSYLNFVDKRFLWVQSYYNDPLAANYGEPESYMVINTVSSGGNVPQVQGNPVNKTAAAVIHESRCIRFDGLTTDVLTRQQMAGWSFSILQPVYDSFRKFETGFDSAGHLLADAAQAVFQMRGLIDAINAGQGAEVQARMRLLDESRAVCRAIVLDAGDGTNGPPETFTRQATTFAGIADVLAMQMMRFAADVDMPQTELFGRSPQGMNATGDSDVRKWYDTIESKQSKEVAPRLVRVYTLMSLASDCVIDVPADSEIKVKFRPLWAATDQEQAQTDLLVAQRDQIYATIEVVTPEELAQDRADLYPSLASEDREEAQAAGKSFDPYENDPADPAIGESNNPSVPLPVPGPTTATLIKPIPGPTTTTEIKPKAATSHPVAKNPKPKVRG